MDASVKILVVEDDMIIAAKIALQLTNLGYEVTALVPRGEEALRHAENVRPDLVLLDIQLKGALDGIETAHRLREAAHTPVIFVTANTDEATFQRARATHPYGFIPKPIKNLDLQRAIELTLSRLADEHHRPAEPQAEAAPDAPYVLRDRIFVRHREKMVRIAVEDIHYLEADRNYCHLHTRAKTYTLATPLKVMEEKLPAGTFLRVHRSFLVNLAQVDEVLEDYVGIGGQTVPLSHSLREELMRRIQTA